MIFPHAVARRARVALVWRMAPALLLPLPAVGCYEYLPVAPASVPQNAQVRARLTDPEIVRLRLSEIMPIEDQTVEGRVLDSTEDTLRLLVPLFADYGFALEPTGLSQQVLIDVDGVLDARLRRLNRFRTGVVTGLGVALITSVIIDNLSGWFGGNREVLGPDKGEIM